MHNVHTSTGSKAGRKIVPIRSNKGVYNVVTLGGNQDMWFLTEDDLSINNNYGRER